MASNIFCELSTVDGPVEGESVVSGFEKQIELSGWSWGVSQVGAAGSAAGGTSGTANVADLVLTGIADKACPILAQAAGLGTHLDKVTIKVCKSGGDLLPFLIIKTKGGILSSVQLGSSNASGTSITTVTFSVNFSEIDFEYTPQDAAGGGGGSTSGSINVAGSTKGG